MRRIPSPRARWRRHARWSVAALGAAALLSACVPVTPPPPPPPPPPTQYCGAGAPTTAAQHQALYDALNTVDAEFAAGDFGYPVDLGAGKTLYLMGDTWVGRVANDAMVDPFRMVHTAFLAQQGACITPTFAGSRGARTDLVPSPATDEWRWPLSGFVDGSQLRMFVQSFRRGSGLCQCIPLGVEVATFSLPGLTLQSVVASPRPEVLPEFGTGVVTADGFHYIYGRDHDLGYVARVPVGADVTDGATWRYWNGGVTGTDADWGTDGTSGCLPGLGGPCPMTFEMPGGTVSTTGPNAGLYVQPDSGGGFVASAMLADVSDPTIAVWHGDTPVGPWLAPQVAAEPTIPSEGFAYAGKVFRTASAGGAAPWMASYSTNVADNHLRISAYKVAFADSGYP